MFLVRLVNSGDGSMSFSKKLEGSKWDAVLLCELGDKNKNIFGNHHVAIYDCAGGFAQEHGVGILLNTK